MSKTTSSNSVSTSPKKAARKASPKPKAKTSAKLPDLVKTKPKVYLRGQIEISLRDAIEFVGGDPDTVVSISRKSLIRAEMANQVAESAKRLETLGDSDL